MGNVVGATAKSVGAHTFGPWVDHSLRFQWTTVPSCLSTYIIFFFFSFHTSATAFFFSKDEKNASPLVWTCHAAQTGFPASKPKTLTLSRLTRPPSPPEHVFGVRADNNTTPALTFLPGHPSARVHTTFCSSNAPHIYEA